jgi:hypothetical protein
MLYMPQKSKFFILLFTLFSITYFTTNGQNNSFNNISFSGFGEAYFTLPLNENNSNEKDAYLYNHKRNNEIAINLLMLKAAYTTTNTRANLAIMAGNYAQYNLAAEPTWAQFIYEANAGIKLSKKNNLWLDVGIMPSHIGFETAISTDCWTLTRSLVADNSPYYESGARLAYTNKKGNLNINLFALNGWQTIQMSKYNNKISSGLQVNYMPNSKLTLNYSNFIGQVNTAANNNTRVYNNLFAKYDGAKFGIIAGLDVGLDFNKNNNLLWYTPVIITKYPVNKKVTLAARAEGFMDEENALNFAESSKLLAFSLNTDVAINKPTLWRTELKAITAYNDINLPRVIDKYMLTTSWCYKF